jgi:hypothetical protein
LLRRSTPKKQKDARLRLIPALPLFREDSLSLLGAEQSGQGQTAQAQLAQPNHSVTTMQHGFVSSNRAGLDEDDSPLSGESWQGRNYKG